MKRMRILLTSFVLVTVSTLNVWTQTETNFWQLTNSPKEGVVKTLTTNSKGHIFAVHDGGFYYYGIYRSTDNGNTWTKLSNSVSTLISSMAIVPGDRIVGGAYKVIYLSTDNGDTWQKRKDVYHGYDFYAVTSFAVTPDSIVYAGTRGDGLYYSDNLGFSWYGNTKVGNNFINTLATSVNGYVFVGTDSWILRQNYNGHVWGSARFSGGGPGGDIISLVTTRKGYVFASTISYSYDVYNNLTGSTSSILRSTEDSVFFSPVNNGLPNSQYSGKYVLSANSMGDIFAGNESLGVYRSTDDGNHWESVNGGLPNLHIHSMAVSPAGYVFIGNEDGLVYRSTQSTIKTTAIATDPLPRTHSLDQNYPNPFNPSTTIEFSLPKSGYTSLKIYNLLGEEVATLISQEILAGTHRAVWDAAKMPSGAYFYRLKAGEFTETKKLLLVK